MKAHLVEQRVAAGREPGIPPRLGRARGAEARGPLQQLAAGERRQRGAVDVAVAAERPQAVVATGDDLRDLRQVPGRPVPLRQQFLAVGGLQHLTAERALEARRVDARLEHDRETHVGDCRPNVGLVGGLHGERHGKPDAVRRCVLPRLVDVRLKIGPPAPRHVEPLAEPGLVRADDLDGLVVRGEKHTGCRQRAAEGLKIRDEPLGVVHRVAHHMRPRVPRQHAERPRVAVGGDHRDVTRGERADDAQRVGARCLQHHAHAVGDGAHPVITRWYTSSMRAALAAHV